MSQADTKGEAYPFSAMNLASREQIRVRISELAKQIAADYRSCGLNRTQNPLVLICVLKGSYMFTADLSRALFEAGVPTCVEFICVSSYESGKTETSGEVRMLLDVRDSIEGKHVLIVEDIVDSAVTLSYLMNAYCARKPVSLKSVVLLDKPSRRKVPFVANYVGFEIPNHFAIGYGMDFDEQYREVPCVVALKPEYYAPPEGPAPTDQDQSSPLPAVKKSKL